jgi:hypothetical protein
VRFYCAAMTENIKRLRSEIADLEARYDYHFPPAIYAVLEKLRTELAWAMHRNFKPDPGQK